MSIKNKEYWDNHINTWKTSNKSMHKYCKENNLIHSTLKRWVDKLDNKIVPVKLVMPFEKNERTSIIIERNGLKITIPSVIEDLKLQIIIKELCRCS